MVTSEGIVRITPQPPGQDWPSVPGLENSSRSRVTNYPSFPATEGFLGTLDFLSVWESPDKLDELVTINGKCHLLQLSNSRKSETSLGSMLHSYLDALLACPVLPCPTPALFNIRS